MELSTEIDRELLSFLFVYTASHHAGSAIEFDDEMKRSSIINISRRRRFNLTLFFNLITAIELNDKLN